MWTRETLHCVCHKVLILGSFRCPPPFFVWPGSVRTGAARITSCPTMSWPTYRQVCLKLFQPNSLLRWHPRLYFIVLIFFLAVGRSVIGLSSQIFYLQNWLLSFIFYLLQLCNGVFFFFNVMVTHQLRSEQSNGVKRVSIQKELLMRDRTLSESALVNDILHDSNI